MSTAIRQWAVAQVMSRQGLDPVTEATADEIIAAAAVLEGYVLGVILPAGPASVSEPLVSTTQEQAQYREGFWQCLGLCRRSSKSPVGRVATPTVASAGAPVMGAPVEVVQ